MLSQAAAIVRNPMKQVIHRRGDQGRAEPGRSQRPLGSNDRGDLIDGQIGTGERVSPPPVELDVPERRRDPIVVGLEVARAVDRSDLRRSVRRRTSSSSQRASRKSRATIRIALTLRCSTRLFSRLRRRGGDEVAEQRMGLGRLRFELGVELDRHETRDDRGVP